MLLVLAGLFPAALAARPATLPSAGDDTFSPDGGATQLSMAALVRGGVVRGRTGRLLVHADDADAIAAIPGVASVRRLPGGVLRVTPAAGTDDLALARALDARPDVAWAHPDLVVRLTPATLPDDPFVGDEWHLENTGQGGRTPDVDIDAERAWTYATGAGVTIAVLDSGVQLDHPDLVVVPGHDYIDQDDDPGPAPGSDEGPHGTCAAGVAAAVGDNTYGVAGVAYGADIYAVRLIGGDTTLDDLYNAFVESVDAGAGVLSNSWGFGTACETVPRYGVFADMFDYAEETGRGGLGSVVVFAAGNGACDIENDHMLGHETAVVVAAIESWDQRAWYSSYGDAVDIAAPTTLLTTDLTEGGYGSYDGDDAFVDGFNGTSAATPVVAGVVALMMEANPRITAAAIRDVLCATAVRTDVANAGYDADGRSPYYGCGRIDAGAAVEAVADTAPDAPEPALVADEVVVGRAVLAWEAAADPDGDVSGYEVSWWRIGGGDDTDPIEETLVPVAGTSLDLGAELDVGDGVTWKVRAVDPWGAGPWSAEQAFTVVAEETAPPPEQESGCRHTSGAGMGGLALAALGLARRRRR